MSANDDYEKHSKGCPQCGPVDRRELHSGRCPRGVGLVQLASAELVREGRANASTTRVVTATRQGLVRRLAQLEGLI